MSKNNAVVEKVKLGDPDVWIKRTSKGKVSAVKAKITLREAQGELVEVAGKTTISALGYRRLNQIASLGVITPDSITIPGPSGAVNVPNPYPIIDKESGTQKGVWVKKIAVGYSPIGSMAVSSTTMYYDFNIYFLEDLQKKVQYDKDAGKLCFKDQLTDQELKTGLFMAIEGSFGIWVDPNHKEILKAISTWIQSKKFGERKAQTVAERNALKHHPALSLELGQTKGEKGNRWLETVVTGWQHDYSAADLEDIALVADAGEEVEIGGEVIEVETIVDDSNPDDEDVAATDDDFDDMPNKSADSDKSEVLW